MTKFLNNINLEAANDIQFKTTAGANAGKISQTGDDLVISNAVGDILLGNGSDDVFIGDGTNAVDIRFEQNMAIFADSSSTRTLTLGGANTSLILESPTISGTFTLGATSINNKLTFTTVNGYILFDYEPSGDTGEYTSEVPLIKIDHNGTEKTILSRVSENGAIQLGHDDTVAITAGDVGDMVKTNWGMTAENVVIAAEGGYYAWGWPNNMQSPYNSWSTRYEMRFKTDHYNSSASDPAADALATNGLYLGSGSSTQFMDMSRNLKNIGTIASGAITSTGIVSVSSGNSFRLYNAAGSGWGELNLNETDNKIQFNRGIQPSGDNQSDQLLGTASKRWHTVNAGAIVATGEVEGGSLDINGNADIAGNLVVDGGNIVIDTDTAGASLTWKESDSAAIAGQLRGYANRGDIYLYQDGVKKTELSPSTDSFIPALHIGGTAAASGGVLQTTGNVNIDGNADISGTITSGAISATGDSIMYGDLTVYKSSSHTAQGTFSASDAHLDLYNPLQANTDQKGSIITFTDNYYDGSGYYKTTRAGIKGGTDTTGNTADGYLEFYTDSGGGNSPTLALRLDKDQNATFAGTVTANGTTLTGNTGTVTGTGTDNRIAIWNGTTAIDSDSDFRVDGDTIFTQNLEAAGNITASGSLTLAEYIYHSGDTTNYHRFLSSRQIFVVGNASSIDLNNGVSTFGATGGATTLQGSSLAFTGAATFNSTIGSGAITSTGKIQGTELEGTSLDINGNADISGALTLGTTLAVAEGGTGLTANTTYINSNAFSNFASSSADWDTITTRGLYRLTGSTNNPFGSSHATGLTLTQGSGDYGFQLFSIGSTNNSEHLMYRYRNTSWGDWQTIVTKTFGDGRYGKIASPTFTGTPAAPTASAGTNTTQLATTAFVSTAVANLVDSAPSDLNTLNELAAALNDDDAFSTTVTNSIAGKVAKSGDTMTGTLITPRVQAEGSSFPQIFVQDTGSGGGSTKTMQIGMSGTSMYFKKSDAGGQVLFRNSNNTDLMTIGLTDAGQVTVLNELEAGSLDINGTADISGSTDIHGTLRLHNGQLDIEDTDGNNLHLRLYSNGTEGTMRVNNGSNWGFIARGVTNSPRIGAYHNGALDIYGFGDSAGADHADDDLLAQFNFGSEKFLVNGEVEATTLDINGDSDISGNLTMSGNGNLVMGTGQLKFANGGDIYLGDSNDLKLYHDGTHSYIEESGAGNLKIRTSALNVMNAANSENMLSATENGAVTLYYDNALKLTTASGGVSITGTATATSLDINGNADISGKLVLPQTSTTIGSSNVGNASLLVGSTSAGIGIDINEIAVKGDHLYIGAIDDGKSIIFRTDASQNALTLDSDQNATFSNTITTGYGVKFTNGNTDFLLYNNPSEDVLYMRDTTNGAMITTWGVNSFTVNKNLDASAGVDVTGNITVTGTVDGRDVAADGTKLDGIESSATADQTAAEILTAIKTVDGAGTGLDADTVDGYQAANLLSRANHTGTQAYSTISDPPTIPSGNQVIDWTQSNQGTIHASNLANDTNTFRTIEIDSTGNNSADSSLGASETLILSKGNNINIDEADGLVQISATGDMTLAGSQTVSGSKTFSATQTFSGIVDITGTTDATNATGDTGILRCEGGASIAKKLYVGSTITGSADVIAFSDRKLKDNIETLDGKKVLDMRGVSFTRKDTGAESSGVIAQEIQKVAPELVHNTEGTLGVAYGNLVGYLIEAVKDQQKQINELKTIINGSSK